MDDLHEYDIYDDGHNVYKKGKWVGTVRDDGAMFTGRGEFIGYYRGYFNKNNGNNTTEKVEPPSEISSGPSEYIDFEIYGEELEKAGKAYIPFSVMLVKRLIITTIVVVSFYYLLTMGRR